MKWKFAPVSFLKNFAAGISVFTMCISPVAQGATAMTQKQKVNKFLKETGLTRQITVGEYWKQFRHVYPLKFRKKMDQWAFVNRKELMPAVEATSFKDKDGKEQVRVTLSKNKQSVVLTYTGDEEKPLKVNGISLSKNEIENLNNFTDVIKKLAKQDKTIAKNLAASKKVSLTHNLVLDFKEYKKLTVRQKAEYFIRLRKAMEASQKVYQQYYGDQALEELNRKYEWVVKFFFGVDAEAKGKSKGSSHSKLTGKPCVVAGYLSIYGENNRCGGATRGWDNLTEQMTRNNASCARKEVACNPMVYGFQTNGGAICVPRGEIRLATQYCNGKSALQDNDKNKEALNKKRIIETYLYHAKGQDITLTLNDEGKIEASQYKEIEAYLNDINQFIASAVDECDKDPLKGIQESRDDQVSACDNIRIRAISLQSFVTAPVPFPPVKPNDGGVAEDKVPDCDTEKPGSSLTYDGDKHSCECPDGTNDYGGRCNPIFVAPVEPKDNCDFWCKYGGWMAVGATAAIGTALYFWLSDDDDDKESPKPVYVPPAGVPEPVPTNPIGNPPIDNPPLAPIPHMPEILCLRPMRIINGVCTLETVVVPPAKPTEGGDKTDIPGRANGIR